MKLSIDLKTLLVVYDDPEHSVLIWKLDPVSGLPITAAADIVVSKSRVKMYQRRLYARFPVCLDRWGRWFDSRLELAGEQRGFALSRAYQRGSRHSAIHGGGAGSSAEAPTIRCGLGGFPETFHVVAILFLMVRSSKPPYASGNTADRVGNERRRPYGCRPRCADKWKT